MERVLMKDILKEQNVQLAGCTSNDCAVEVGKIVGVKQIIGRSISKVGDVYSMFVRIICLNIGEIWPVASYDQQ